MNHPTSMPAAPRNPLRKIASGLALTVAALFTLLFGAIPFLCGFLLQLATRRKLSDIILNAAGAAVVLLLWHFTGWLPVVFGDPPPGWVSILLSTVLGAGFAVTGGFVCRRVFRQRYTIALRDS